MSSALGSPAGLSALALLEAVSALLDGVSLATSDPDASAPAAGPGLFSLSGAQVGDLVRAALVLRARLDAVLLAGVREADVRGLCHDTGMGSTADWVALLARVERGEARGLVEQAAALAPGLGVAAAGVDPDPGAVSDPDAPLLAVADREGVALGAEVAAGRVTRAQAAAIERAVAALPHDTDLAGRCHAEALLAGYARTLTPRQLARAGARIGHAYAATRPDTDDPAERAAAERAEVAALAAYEKREAWWRRRPDGMVEGGFRLDPVSAAPVITFLDAASRLNDPDRTGPTTRRRPEPSLQPPITPLPVPKTGPVQTFPEEPEPPFAHEDDALLPGMREPVPDGAAGGGNRGPLGWITGVPPPEDHPPGGPVPGGVPERLPRAGGSGWDERTRGQRQADALSTLCRYVLDGLLSGYLLPEAATRHPHISVTLDLARLSAGLDRSGVLDLLHDPYGTSGTGSLSASQARALACGSRVIPVVLDGASLPLDVGRSRRLATPAQREALARRDAGCVMPGCDVPPPGCIAHHLRGWADPHQPGHTDLANLALLCPHHHTQIHAQRWTASLSPDGTVELTPPAEIDPRQQPRRHERHAARALRRP